VSRLFELNADPDTHVPGRPVVTVDEGFDGIRVRVAVNGADVYVRATWGGRRFTMLLDEGDGAVDCEWAIRMSAERQPVITGPFVQSPQRQYVRRFREVE
jgi:hypothetical protein